MFVLPLLIFPLVFGLAMYRLYQVPRKLLRGELRFPVECHVGMKVAVAAAYLTLLACTVALCAAGVQAAVFAENSLDAFGSLVVHVAAYPVVYVCVAWVFFHGLKGAAQGAP